MVLTDDVHDFLNRQWEEKDWKMQYQQLYTLLDYAIEQAYEQGVTDPSTAVKEQFMVLDPTLTYDEAKEELFEMLGLSLPGEARDVVEELERELSEIKAQRDALEELVEETPKAKRIRELESELESREATIDKLESRLEGLRKETRGKKKVPVDLRKDIDRVEESVLDLSEKVDKLESNFADALRELVEELRVAKEEEVETLPGPPDILQNIVKRHPEMGEAPRFIQTVKGEIVEQSWDEFLTFLDATKNIDLEDLRRYNEQAAPVPKELPPEESKERRQEAERATEIIYGHFKSYMDWKQKGHKVPEKKPLTEMEVELRELVYDVVEEQKPELRARTVWRTVRDAVEKELTLEENRKRVKRELSKYSGIEFPELEEEIEEKKEKVEKFVKENIREKTDQDPEKIWSGLEIKYSEAETVSENIELMKELMGKQFDIKTFLEVS